MQDCKNKWKKENKTLTLPTSNVFSNSTIKSYDDINSIVVDPFSIGFFTEDYECEFLFPGSKLVITEAQAFYDSDDYKSMRQNFIGWHQKSRHFDIDIYANAQRNDKIAPDIARLVNLWITPVPETIRVTRNYTLSTCICYLNWEDAKKGLIPPCEDYNKEIKQRYKQIDQVKKYIKKLQKRIKQLKNDIFLNIILFVKDRTVKNNAIRNDIERINNEILNLNNEIEKIHASIQELANMPYWYQFNKYEGNVFLHYNSNQYYAKFLDSFQKRIFKPFQEDTFYDKDNPEQVQKFCDEHIEERPIETTVAYENARKKENTELLKRNKNAHAQSYDNSIVKCIRKQ